MRSAFLSIFLFGSLLAKPIVLVSVAPQKFIVESIAGDACIVEVLVPAGASPHTYEPKVRQIDTIQQAQLWLRIGEGFEERLLPLVKKVVDQRANLQLIGGCCCHEGADPHIWLSPKMLKKQAVTVCDALEELLETDLHPNLEVLLEKLDALEQKLDAHSYPCAILVSHPAFGYFCRDYGIEQLSVEMEGREPSPKELAFLMDEVTRKEIHSVYLQEQYSKKGGLQIAKQLKLNVKNVDPYAENVIANLETIGELFCDQR